MWYFILRENLIAPGDSAPSAISVQLKVAYQSNCSSVFVTLKQKGVGKGVFICTKHLYQ